MLSKVTFQATFIALCTMLSAGAYAIADTPQQVDIPAGELSTALLKLSKQYGADLVYRPEQVHGFRTQGAHGSLTTAQAATQLLQGTPLELRTDPSGAMLIAPPSAASAQGTANQSGSNAARDASDDSKEAGKKSSQDFLVAQVDQGATGPKAVDGPNSDSLRKEKQEGLSEIVVTGSRIPVKGEGAQEVKIYTREIIDQSGQSTVSDFLGTLPEVSVSLHDNGLQNSAYQSTVQLHGLPVGTTLVLLNGRRLEGSGAGGGNGYDYFDLNNIPLSAVERIEVVPSGSSAIYGSDAIAGVVNIVLKKDLDGVEANAKYGFASGTEEWTTDMTWGKRWDRGSVSIIGSFQTNSELRGFDRSLTANNNYTPFGGIDARLNTCNPGDIYSADGVTPLPGAPAGSNATYAAVSSTAKAGKPALTNFNYGALNACSYDAYSSYIPQHRQTGALAQGSFSLTPSAELFSEIEFTRQELTAWAGPPILYGAPGDQEFPPLG